MMDKGMMLVKMISITPYEITYERLDTKTKSICTRKKQFFAYVIYKNGIKEVFNDKGKDYVYRIKKPKKFKSSPLDEIDYKKNRLTFSANILQMCINEVGGNIDYVRDYRNSIGINAGYVYEFWSDNGLVTDQAGDWPACVYNGMAYRLNYKYYIFHSRRVYLSPQLIYQNLSYTNHSFSDFDRWGTQYFIVRSETAKVYGMDFIIGFHIRKPQAKLNLEVFGGLAYRHRIRDYNTIGSYYYTAAYGRDYFTDTKHPIGLYHQEQDYPMITIGLKIGINTFFK